jgi:hypothetical protein
VRVFLADRIFSSLSIKYQRLNYWIGNAVFTIPIPADSLFEIFDIDLKSKVAGTTGFDDGVAANILSLILGTMMYLI